MSHEVVKQVDQIAEQLASTAEESETLGKLCVQSVKLIRQAGVMRMLQPTEFGGYAAHPRDFAEAVLAVAKACGSTGWVCGVGGVHPWEMALMDRRLQSEVWAVRGDVRAVDDDVLAGAVARCPSSSDAPHTVQ